MPPLNVDLGFAISVTDIRANETYENMKDVVKYIVNTQGIANIRYGIILFADSANTYIPFSHTFPDKGTLMSLLDAFPAPLGSPDLQKALDEAKSMFDKAPSRRPGAKKVLVVIMDKKSINDAIAIRKAATGLEEEDIQVIPVGVGANVDDEHLESITSNKKNVITTDKDGDPSSVGKEILEKIIQGKDYIKNNGVEIVLKAGCHCKCEHWVIFHFRLLVPRTNYGSCQYYLSMRSSICYCN